MCVALSCFLLLSAMIMMFMLSCPCGAPLVMDSCVLVHTTHTHASIPGARRTAHCCYHTLCVSDTVVVVSHTALWKRAAVTHAKVKGEGRALWHTCAPHPPDNTAAQHACKHLRGNQL